MYTTGGELNPLGWLGLVAICGFAILIFLIKVFAYFNDNPAMLSAIPIVVYIGSWLILNEYPSWAKMHKIIKWGVLFCITTFTGLVIAENIFKGLGVDLRNTNPFIPLGAWLIAIAGQLYAIYKLNKKFSKG